jgi:hypothetical protein
VTIAEFQFLGAAALIFMPLERLLPLHRDKKTLRPGLGVDVLHVIVSGVFIRVGIVATGLTLSYVCALVVPERVQNVIQGQSGWIQFVELLLLKDLCFVTVQAL